MQQPTKDYEPGQVVQVLQQGFMLHDRVLRPTSVIVAAAHRVLGCGKCEWRSSGRGLSLERALEWGIRDHENVPSSVFQL